jgi:hypothetical protein
MSLCMEVLQICLLALLVSEITFLHRRVSAPIWWLLGASLSDFFLELFNFDILQANTLPKKCLTLGLYRQTWRKWLFALFARSSSVSRRPLYAAMSA